MAQRTMYFTVKCPCSQGDGSGNKICKNGITVKSKTRLDAGDLEQLRYRLQMHIETLHEDDCPGDPCELAKQACADGEYWHWDEQAGAVIPNIDPPPYERGAGLPCPSRERSPRGRHGGQGRSHGAAVERRTVQNIIEDMRHLSTHELNGVAAFVQTEIRRRSRGGQ
jgi:hypothetical protein